VNGLGVLVKGEAEDNARRAGKREPPALHTSAAAATREASVAKIQRLADVARTSTIPT